MSAPGSAALLTLFRLSGIHRCCPTWGFGFHHSLSTRSVCQCSGDFKAKSPRMQPHRFLVSLHIHDTTYSFRISPCTLCSLLWISRLWHSTEIDSLSVVVFPLASSTSANNHKARLTNFPDRWIIGVFFGAFCAVLLYWYLLTVGFRL